MKRLPPGATIYTCDGPDCDSTQNRADGWFVMTVVQEGEAGFGDYYRSAEYHFCRAHCLRRFYSNAYSAGGWEGRI